MTGTAHSGARLVERGAKGIGHPAATPETRPRSRARPSASLLFFALPPFPLGATSGQQLTSPASKPSWSLKMVFPRRLGRNSSGGAPWECKSEGYGKIFLFLPNSTKPLTRTQLLYHLAFSSTGALSSCIIPAAPT